MKIPRQPHRYSGRTAMLANIKVSEPQQPLDSETPFAFSMEGAIANVTIRFGTGHLGARLELKSGYQQISG